MKQKLKYPNNPLIYILVLSNNSLQWLSECFVSLAQTAYANKRLVLIDNASDDRSVEYVSTHYPNCHVIRNSRNLGWCEANNIGIQFALTNGADYVVLLNSDIKTDRVDWLENLVRFGESQEEFGILGCVQYDYYSEGWDTPNNWTKYILENGNRDVHYMWDPILKTRYSKPAYNNWMIDKRGHLECRFVQGAAMMVKRHVFEAVGFFDPIYFIYFDEIDFSRRARWLGYRTALVCNSKIKHKGGGDTLGTPNHLRTRNFYYSRNKYIFILSDLERDLRTIFSIIYDWLIWDWADAVDEKKDVSGKNQYVSIICSLVLNIPRIVMKRWREKKLLHGNISN